MCVLKKCFFNKRKIWRQKPFLKMIYQYKFNLFFQWWNCHKIFKPYLLLTFVVPCAPDTHHSGPNRGIFLAQLGAASPAGLPPPWTLSGCWTSSYKNAGTQPHLDTRTVSSPPRAYCGCCEWTPAILLLLGPWTLLFAFTIKPSMAKLFIFLCKIFHENHNITNIQSRYIINSLKSRIAFWKKKTAVLFTNHKHKKSLFILRKSVFTAACSRIFTLQRVNLDWLVQLTHSRRLSIFTYLSRLLSIGPIVVVVEVLIYGGFPHQ